MSVRETAEVSAVDQALASYAVLGDDRNPGDKWEVMLGDSLGSFVVTNQNNESYQTIIVAVQIQNANGLVTIGNKTYQNAQGFSFAQYGEQSITMPLVAGLPPDDYHVDIGIFPSDWGATRKQNGKHTFVDPWHSSLFTFHLP